MNEVKPDIQAGEVCSETEADEEIVQENEAQAQPTADAQAEFTENYRQLPVWKQVILLVLFLGGMTAVIMLINFIVEFGSELIKALFQ